MPVKIVFFEASKSFSTKTLWLKHYYRCQGFVHNIYLGERKTHKHKQICGIVPGLDGRQKFVYMFFCSGIIPYGGEKAHKQNPPRIPGQSREMLFTCFSCKVVAPSGAPPEELYERVYIKKFTRTSPQQKNLGRLILGNAFPALVAPYRAILRYYRCDTTYRAIRFQGG